MATLSRSPVLPAVAPGERPRTGPAVTLEVVDLRYDGRTLLRDLRLELPAGQWTCLLGPSGVGKTTLLRLIAGLEEGGRVRIDGHGRAGSIALMAQQDLLLPWLSVRDNVLLGHRLRGASRGEFAELAARADALLERVGLAGRGQAAPATLSGGMRQRVALARTLMEQRPVVLMDEPFSALDAITRHRLQDLAAELLEGRTVLLVTHQPTEALRLSDRIWVLSGRPARLQGPILPKGPAPRDPSDPALARLQAELLAELLASARATEAA
ncbi:ABC transporter ATP-binding protein [Geminicoccus roseus]|uniref:ABC transporter ATP-binding protein n=1 Tax=Geminicoccus roseus TaxID=404900 RepID=UPI00040653D3|nr:ABC transporter ATP-binding protein [Geminicoccus roseus]